MRPKALSDEMSVYEDFRILGIPMRAWTFLAYSAGCDSIETEKFETLCRLLLKNCNAEL